MIRTELVTVDDGGKSVTFECTQFSSTRSFDILQKILLMAVKAGIVNSQNAAEGVEAISRASVNAVPGLISGAANISEAELKQLKNELLQSTKYVAETGDRLPLDWDCLGLYLDTPMGIFNLLSTIVKFNFSFLQSVFPSIPGTPAPTSAPVQPQITPPGIQPQNAMQSRPIFQTVTQAL